MTPQDTPRMGDLNELVERLNAPGDLHGGWLDLMSEAAAALASLITERDAAVLCAEYESGDPDAASRFRQILADKADAEAQLKAAREALERIVSADTKLIYRGMATVADHAEIGPAGEIAMAALSLDTNKGDGV